MSKRRSVSPKSPGRRRPERPPRWYPLLVLAGFCTTIVWLDLLANEVVAIIESFGLVSGISTSILGLTVIAVGNSIGDFVADTAAAHLEVREGSDRGERLEPSVGDPCAEEVERAERGERGGEDRHRRVGDRSRVDVERAEVAQRREERDARVGEPRVEEIEAGERGERGERGDPASLLSRGLPPPATSAAVVLSLSAAAAARGENCICPWPRLTPSPLSAALLLLWPLFF